MTRFLRSELLSKNLGTIDDKVVQCVLDKNEGFLKRHLVLSPSILGKCLTSGVLNEAAHARMKGQPNEIQVNMILNILRTSGMRIFRKFIEVLKTSLDSWVADVMLETNVADAAMKSKKCIFNDYLKHEVQDYSDDSAYQSGSFVHNSSEEIPAARFINGYDRPKSNPENMTVRFQRGNGVVTSNNLQRMAAMFESERQTQESVLAELRQDESAIRDLLEQNLREQSKIRRSQNSLFTIDKMLKKISLETTQIAHPPARSTKTRDRLHFLQNKSRSNSFRFAT